MEPQPIQFGKCEEGPINRVKGEALSNLMHTSDERCLPTLPCRCGERPSVISMRERKYARLSD